MPIDKFLIAPIRSGLQLNMKPWLIMDDAFEELVNVHCWRERIQKRFGADSMNPTKSSDQQQFFSRLRINIGTTDAMGALGATVVPGIIFKVGQSFSCDIEMYTVITAGNPAACLSTGTGFASYSTVTGTFTLVGGPALADVYFYPAEPVMALPTYDVDNVNNEEFFAIDTQFAYFFVKANGWQRLGTAVWTGNNSDFHWTTNYRGAAASNYLLFVVNNVIADTIKYWDSANWAAISPIYNSATGNVIRTAKLVLPFQDRLILLNTTEQVGAGNSIFTNRIRWSQNGSPLTVDAWYENVAGKGGFLEAPVREAIISAGYIKDRLIIFFEQSTWELQYTNNQVLPFQFRRIDTNLGVESMNSIITFDKVLLGMGSTGVHACNGMNVERVDQNIPDIIFDISNQQSGPQRVFGIRDFFTQEVYWSYSSASVAKPNAEIFPNQLLIYNYLTGSWATYDDSITAFGYYQNEGNLTWDDLDMQWQEAAFAWNDPSRQSLFRQVVGGNQQGFTFVVNHEKTNNSRSYSITNITIAGNVISIKSLNHNLDTSDYVYIENIVSDNNIEDLNGLIFQVNTVTSADIFTILENGIAGTYEGLGVFTRVSLMTIRSKQYNFYNKIGKKIQIPRIDFLVDKTVNGEVLLDYSLSFSDLSLVEQAALTNTLMGTSVLPTIALADIEQTQSMLWRAMFPYLEGETIQFVLTLDQDQILDPDIAFSDFELHAVVFYARPTSDFSF